ncbi:maleylpyruvate isomerase N-terminal domain-containing protein [Pseudonocardia sp. NPDC049154]|uniref:maleylpyruvate isomerase N-terminal domain-containing protein n=1 Tax=Pseudonocardia sp. NPDC049154 TaxID=3155501 RepID=UPI0033FA7DD8
MDRDEKWAVIAGRRRELADLLAGLHEEEWERPSLCAEWRIRDVAAHVALTPQSPGILRILAAGVRAGGDFQALSARLVATDVDWTAGDADGAEIRGSADALLLLLTGRSAAALPRLTGDGLERLAAP